MQYDQYKNSNGQQQNNGDGDGVQNRHTYQYGQYRQQHDEEVYGARRACCQSNSASTWWKWKSTLPSCSSGGTVHRFDEKEGNVRRSEGDGEGLDRRVRTSYETMRTFPSAGRNGSRSLYLCFAQCADTETARHVARYQRRHALHRFFP